MVLQGRESCSIVVLNEVSLGKHVVVWGDLQFVGRNAEAFNDQRPTEAAIDGWKPAGRFSSGRQGLLWNSSYVLTNDGQSLPILEKWYRRSSLPNPPIHAGKYEVIGRVENDRVLGLHLVVDEFNPIEITDW